MRVSGFTSAAPGGSKHLTRWGEAWLIPHQRPQAAGAANFDGRMSAFGGAQDNAQHALLQILSANNGGGGPSAQAVAAAGVNYLELVAPASGAAAGNEYLVLYGGVPNLILGSGPTLHSAAPARVGGSLFVPPVLAWCIEACLRKVNAGDIIPSGCGLGFRTVSQYNGANPAIQLTYTGGGTQVQGRFGLMGDGLGGWQFGAWHCPGPDTPGAAVPITYADGGSVVQPTALVAPGTNEVHVRIKWVPALSAGNPGQLLCYVEGVLVATLAAPATFPTGLAGMGAWVASSQVAAGQFSLRHLHCWLDEDTSNAF